MKKFIAILASALLLMCLLSCSYRGTYDDGYEDGYDEGYFDAMIKFEDYYDRGYGNGYNEGSDDREYDIRNSLEAAEDYARDQTGWSVYEAWNSIMIYHDGYDPDGFPLPTKEEYRQCVETLVLFCEYLDNEY